jgi:streptogramin lyase
MHASHGFLGSLLRRLVGGPAVSRPGSRLSSSRARPARPLVLEALEDRLCLSPGLLVSDSLANSVMDYNGTTGRWLGAFVQSGYGGLTGPHGIVFGTDGNLLVSSTESHSVLRYDSTTGAYLGAFVPAFSGGLNRPTGLAFGPDGNLYVGSFETAKILRYDGSTGAFLNEFVPYGGGGLSGPIGLLFGPDGNLYVNNSNAFAVMRYDGITGAPLPGLGLTDAFFTAPGSGGLSYPNMGLTFGPDGNLYVGGFGSNNVVRYDGSTGAFLDQFVVAGSGGLGRTRSISFGPDGNLYVASPANSSVLRYDGTTGAFLGAFASGGLLRDPNTLLFWDTDAPTPAGGAGMNSQHIVNNTSGTAPGGPSDRFTVTPIDVLGARSPLAIGINPAGEVVGPYAAADDTTHGLLPGRGTLTTPAFPGAVSADAHPIDARGDVVGAHTRADGTTHGYLPSRGELTSVDVGAGTFGGGMTPDGPFTI